MTTIALELKVADAWGKIGSVTEHEPPGSLSSNGPGGRQVYLFGWFNGEGPAVWRSVAGVDEEIGVARILNTSGLEKIADLQHATTHEMDWYRRGVAARIRFRAVT